MCGKFKLKIQQQKYNLSSLKPFSLIILCASECISLDNNLKEFNLELISSIIGVEKFPSEVCMLAVRLVQFNYGVL